MRDSASRIRRPSGSVVGAGRPSTEKALGPVRFAPSLRDGAVAGPGLTGWTQVRSAHEMPTVKPKVIRGAIGTR